MVDGNRAHPLRPIAGVGVVVFDAALENVLMIRRGKTPGEGSWSIPGGAQRIGEPLEDAARREVFEETGIAVRLVRLAGAFDYIEHDDGGAVRHHYTLIDYAGIAEGETPVAGDDARHAEWVPFEKAVALPSWPETARLIQEVRAMLRDGKS